MRTTKKSLSLLLALVLMLTAMVTVFVGCQPTGDPNADTSADTGAGTGDETTATPSGKANYTVEVKTVGGLLMKDVTVYIFCDPELQDLDGHAVTDENGIAKFSLDASKTYYIELSGVPEGYNVEKSYTFGSTRTATITLTSSVIEDTNISGVSYKLGSVMHDFTVVDSDGTSHTLSKLLETKKAVVLNFWFTTCTYCVEEFPSLNTVYDKYKDKLEVLALNDTDDTEEEIQLFKSSMGLTFPMVKDYSTVGTAFSVTGYPTTVVIDRYGVAVLVASGALSEKQFDTIFGLVTADEYTQKLYANPDDLTPAEKPTLQMPSSEEIKAAFNQGDMTVTYKPEEGTDAAEWSWPFVVGEKGGETCIYPTNKGQDSSFATLYAYVTLKKGDVLALDYYASSEFGADNLFILVDRKDIFTLTGESTEWKTCYPYVALEDGEYEVAFCYYKDESTDVGDDTVYMKDFRIVKEADINVETYIPRYAATNLREDGFGYENYVTVVYNETDKYYHVGTENGPLLLVNLMMATQFSGDPIYSLAYTGKIVKDGKNYYEDMLNYFNMASNASLYGYCAVNQELREYLEITADVLGLEKGNENQWLQMCAYYDAYGKDAEGNATPPMPDPCQGLSAATAFKAELGDNNEVSYDRVIMPRGLWYEFIPEVSGAYRITSHSDIEVDGWVFLADGTLYYEHTGGERYLAVNDESYYGNVSMVVYMEAGTPYYIDIAYYDVYQVGTFKFSVEYLGENYKQFTLASPGFFTFPDNGDSTDVPADESEILSGGIDIMLGTDGFYHEKLTDAEGNVTEGSILYADFLYATAIFSHSIEELIESGAFNFGMTESDQEIKAYIAKYGDETETKLKEIWGESFEELAEEYKLSDCLQGKWHGKGEDLTEDISAFLAKKIAKTDEAPELEGCVPVDEELATLLQKLMDKFTFSGVDYSWAKLCYYYRNVDKAGA